MAKQLWKVNVLIEEVAMAWQFHRNATLPETNFPSYGWTESFQVKDFS